MTTEDKTRTIEAATGQLNERETLTIGKWKIGYLSLKNSEARKVERAEESGRFSDLLDMAYGFFVRRYIGNEPPTQEEFEDATDQSDIAVMLGWLNGVSEEDTRRSLEDRRRQAVGKAISGEGK